MMDKEALLEMSQAVNLEYEPGISQEISDFFTEYHSVTGFTSTFENSTFYVSVNVKQLDVPKVRDLFFSFLHFTSYDSSFFVCERTEKTVTYTLLSKISGLNKGFLCELYFY
ncbi:hypothetical protein [Salibacterium aidingense]|uniref:hypothetical protein n=1 Tax=Salibacterium aidingense TaxID=384933 RepID=UPI0003FDA389|nr:hypothetical protein [Salibacterium aidingense]